MTSEAYKKHVALLLNVIPEIAKEKNFALHGGTAINLFVRDMARLSVDIDLTYSFVEDRATSLVNIAAGLERIKKNIEKNVPNARAVHREEIGKLLVAAKGVDIKVEVSLVSRGLLGSPVKMALCKKLK
jgi:predicted nucleotidyltransferase component of viral defense system